MILQNQSNMIRWRSQPGMAPTKSKQASWECKLSKSSYCCMFALVLKNQLRNRSSSRFSMKPALKKEENLLWAAEGSFHSFNSLPATQPTIQPVEPVKPTRKNQSKLQLYNKLINSQAAQHEIGWRSFNYLDREWNEMNEHSFHIFCSFPLLSFKAPESVYFEEIRFLIPNVNLARFVWSLFLELSEMSDESFPFVSIQMNLKPNYSLATTLPGHTIRVRVMTSISGS